MFNNKTPQTYCNPLVIPDYPRGGESYNPEQRDFRELADPSVIFTIINGICIPPVAWLMSVRTL